MSIAAYKRTIRESESPRQIERRILSRVTTDLETHAATFDGAGTRMERSEILASGLRDALHENQRIWAALAHDLAEPANALPQGLRASLISIAMWVERHSNAVIGGQSGVAALVQVNRNIVAGLSGQKPQPIG